MDNISKLLRIIFVLSLVALPLTGCDNPPWESGMVLNLKVDTPRDGATVTAPAVTVSGRVTGTESKGAKVKINDAEASVKDGKFSADVTLAEGKNVITVTATSGQANPKQEITVTFAPAPK